MTDRALKLSVLEALVEHVIPGRSAEARPPSEGELKATLVVSFPIDEASAKVRTGPPVDEAGDYALPVWAGVVPLKLTAGAPVDDPKLSKGTPKPPYVMKYGRPAAAACLDVD